MEDKALVKNRIVRNLSLWAILISVSFESYRAYGGLILKREKYLHYIDRDWEGLLYTNALMSCIVLLMIAVPKYLTFRNNVISFHIISKLILVVFVLSILYSIYLPEMFISIPLYASVAIIILMIGSIVLLNQSKIRPHILGVHDTQNEIVNITIKELEFILFRVILTVSVFTIVYWWLSYLVFPQLSHRITSEFNSGLFHAIQLLLIIFSFYGFKKYSSQSSDLSDTIKGYLSILCRVTGFYIFCSVIYNGLYRIIYATNMHIRPMIFATVIILGLFLSPKLLKNIPLKNNSLTDFAFVRITIIYLSIFFVASQTIYFNNLGFDYNSFGHFPSLYYIYIAFFVVTIMLSGFITRMIVKDSAKIPE